MNLMNELAKEARKMVVGAVEWSEIKREINS